MAVADVPFDLAEVKLSAPSARPGTVPKTDVIARLRTTRAPFVTVLAPAGYGKTTLLSRWADADARPFAWVALDGGDDDAVVFLRYVAAALHRIEPLPSAVFDALSGPGRSTWARRVPAVGRAMAALGRSFVLVLDDLHAIVNPACLDALAELFEYIPRGSTIAIASREAPELRLARWRAQGAVGEVGVADLRLDAAEAGLLMAEAGVELNPGELTELTRRTEGWPAGLYLAALSMQAGASKAATVSGFAGNDRFVSDYFRLELLARLPPAELQFLVSTAVLDRMCGGLCDAVADTTGSAAMLESLERANCFVLPLDRTGEWYRYHHLFGDLLRQELERRAPRLVAELNRRAMAWCLANDMTEAAVVYGHAAGETTTVAGLVDELALPLHYDGRMDTLDEWLGWFGDEDLRRYPALAVYGAWVRALTGRPEDAERRLALADGARSEIPLSDGSATVQPWVTALRAHMMAAGVDQALVDAEQALEHLAPGSPWIPTTLLARGVARSILGATTPAVDDLAAAADAGRAMGSLEEVYLAEAQLALLAARAGAWADAEHHAHAAQTTVDDAGLGDYSSSAIAHVATARVALHGARPSDARAALARTHRLRPLLDHGIPWITVQVGLELARAHLALGEASAARVVLIDTACVLELRPSLGRLVDDARELHDRVAATAEPAGAWAMSLTGAEIRLLPYLATHLTFPEIASRLYVSRNTVKTEAISVYRKLGASSRSEAVDRAVEVGLLEPTVLPPSADLTLRG